jgi:hypothetical protein
MTDTDMIRIEGAKHGRHGPEVATISAPMDVRPASRMGNQILYANGGAIVEAWRQRD